MSKSSQSNVTRHLAFAVHLSHYLRVKSAMNKLQLQSSPRGFLRLLSVYKMLWKTKGTLTTWAKERMNQHVGEWGPQRWWSQEHQGKFPGGSKNGNTSGVPPTAQRTALTKRHSLSACHLVSGDIIYNIKELSEERSTSISALRFHDSLPRSANLKELIHLKIFETWVSTGEAEYKEHPHHHHHPRPMLPKKTKLPIICL